MPGSNSRPNVSEGYEVTSELPGRPVLYVCIYVCMIITYSRVCFNRAKLPILFVVSRTRKMIFPSPRTRLRIWSRETGSGSPSRVSLVILHVVLRLSLILTQGIPPDFSGGVHLITPPYAMVSPEFTWSRNCVKMAFTAEGPPAQGQY